MVKVKSDPKSTSLVPIGDAAIMVGVSIDTLRRWEKKGRIHSFRSPGGHRYFSKSELQKVFNKRYKRHKTTKPDRHSALTKVIKSTPKMYVEEVEANTLSKAITEIPLSPGQVASNVPPYTPPVAQPNPTPAAKTFTDKPDTKKPLEKALLPGLPKELSFNQKLALLIFFLFIIVDLILLMLLFSQ